MDSAFCLNVRMGTYLEFNCACVMKQQGAVLPLSKRKPNIPMSTLWCHILIICPTHLLGCKYSATCDVSILMEIDSPLIVHLTELSVSRLYSIRWWDDWWTGKNLEGSSYGLIKVLIPEFAWKDWRKPQKTSVWVVSVLAEIWANNLPNTCPFSDTTLSLF
jgi:hypothetical protein